MMTLDEFEEQFAKTLFENLWNSNIERAQPIYEHMARNFNETSAEMTRAEDIVVKLMLCGALLCTTAYEFALDDGAPPLPAHLDTPEQKFIFARGALLRMLRISMENTTFEQVCEGARRIAN